VGEIGAGAGSSVLEDPDTNISISGLVLSNSLLYNLHDR